MSCSPWFSPFDWSRKKLKVPILQFVDKNCLCAQDTAKASSSSFLKECYFRKCDTSSKWSIFQSRCGDHRQYSGNLPQSSTGNAAIFHLVEKSLGPGRSRQYPPGPWRVPFSQGFSRTELATTKKCESRPGQRADVPRGIFPLRARGPAPAQTSSRACCEHDFPYWGKCPHSFCQYRSENTMMLAPCGDTPCGDMPCGDTPHGETSLRVDRSTSHLDMASDRLTKSGLFQSNQLLSNTTSGHGFHATARRPSQLVWSGSLTSVKTMPETSDHLHHARWQTSRLSSCTRQIGQRLGTALMELWSTTHWLPDW